MTIHGFVLRFAIAFALLEAGASTAIADGPFSQDIPSTLYTYGESCNQLSQLSRVEMAGITHQAYAEQFSYFCKPDGVYRCQDYNALVDGFGGLEDNGPSCRYLPR